MTTFTISRNGAGVTSKKLVTDLPADVVNACFARTNFAHTVTQTADGWTFRANRNEEATISSLLRSECERIKIEAARAEAAATSENVVQFPATTEAPRRAMVEAGKIAVGSVIGGRVVTGLGRSFRSNPDQLAANGIGPWVEFVQYAYFD